MVAAVHALRNIFFKYHKFNRLEAAVLEAAKSSSRTIARLLWLYIHSFGQCYGLAYIPNRFAYACTMYEHMYKIIYLCVSHREGTQCLNWHPSTCSTHTNMNPDWSYSSSPADQDWCILVKYVCTYMIMGHSNSWPWVFSLSRSWPKSPCPFGYIMWIYEPLSLAALLWLLVLWCLAVTNTPILTRSLQ